MSRLLDEIRGRGIEIIPVGTDIRCRAPRGVLTPDLVEKIRVHKSELLAALQTGPCLEEPLVRHRWGLPPPEEFPLASDPPRLTRRDMDMLCAAIERQARVDCPGVLEWLLGSGGQADRYEVAYPSWTPAQCDMAAILDLLLWQREGWLEGDTREDHIKSLLEDLEPEWVGGDQP